MPLAFDRNTARCGASRAQPGRLTRAARNRFFHLSSLMVHVYLFGPTVRTAIGISRLMTGLFSHG
ncbi:hypothetical protein GCM10022221_20440 [Actinocorallia aurea]